MGHAGHHRAQRRQPFGAQDFIPCRTQLGQRGLQFLVAARQRTLGTRQLDVQAGACQHLLRVIRLADEVDRAGLEAAHPVVAVMLGRQENHRHRL